MGMNYHHSKVKHQMERRFTQQFNYRKQDKCKLFIDKLSWFSANVVNKQGEEVSRFEGTNSKVQRIIISMWSSEPFTGFSCEFFLSGTFYWRFTTKYWELSLCCGFSSEQIRNKHVPHLLEMTSDDVFQVNINHINNDVFEKSHHLSGWSVPTKGIPHPILKIVFMLELPEWERRARISEGLSRRIFLIQTTVHMGMAQCYAMLSKQWS